MCVHTRTWMQMFLVVLLRWTTQMFILQPVEGLNKLVQYYHGLFLSDTKEQTIDTWNKLDDSPKNYRRWKKASLKGYILYKSTFITFLKW